MYVSQNLGCYHTGILTNSRCLEQLGYKFILYTTLLFANNSGYEQLTLIILIYNNQRFRDRQTNALER